VQSSCDAATLSCFGKDARVRKQKGQESTYIIYNILTHLRHYCSWVQLTDGEKHFRAKKINKKLKKENTLIIRSNAAAECSKQIGKTLQSKEDKQGIEDEKCTHYTRRNWSWVQHTDVKKNFRAKTINKGLKTENALIICSNAAAECSKQIGKTLQSEEDKQGIEDGKCTHHTQQCCSWVQQTDRKNTSEQRRWTRDWRRKMHSLYTA